MKKFLLSLTLASAFAMPLLADNPVSEPLILDAGDFYFIPSVFSYDGKTQVISSYGDCFIIRNSDFGILKTIQIDSSSSVKCPYYTNPEMLSITDMDLPLTQTLFNTDEHYEYMIEVRESNFATGFKIVNDEGRILQTVSYPQGFGDSNYAEVNVWNINDEYFLFVNTGWSEDILVYKINRSDSGTPLTYSGAMKSRMAVSPRAARRSMPVTVSLDDDADYSDVQLVDESGRTVMSVPVNGQTSIVIETSSLRSGMYIVRATGDAGEHEACKIIIR